MADESVPNENRKSSYRGVSWHNKKSRWYARINTADKKTISLGYFASERDAAKAYDFAAEHLKLDDKRLNLPKEKTPDSVVRVVRPKLKELSKSEKMVEELANLDPRFAWDGSQNGRNFANAQWAQGHKPVVIPENLDMNDILLVSQVMSDIGALGKFFSAVTIKDLRLDSDAKELAWMTGFLHGAQDFWEGRESETPAPSTAAVNLDEYKGDMRQLAENFGSPRARGSDHMEEPLAKAVPFEVSQPIYSEHCNPETLARDNAAIKKAMAEKTGLFGKIARREELIAAGHTSSEAFAIIGREDRDRCLKSPAESASAETTTASQTDSLAEIDGLLAGIL